MARDPTEPNESAAIFVVRDIAARLAYFRDKLVVGSPDPPERGAGD